MSAPAPAPFRVEIGEPAFHVETGDTVHGRPDDGPPFRLGSCTISLPVVVRYRGRRPPRADVERALVHAIKPALKRRLKALQRNPDHRFMTDTVPLIDFEYAPLQPLIPGLVDAE